jgi:type I restriction enzyme S subunit
MGKQTTNLASINLATLRSFPVPDIPINRQREIVAEIERHLSLLDSLQSVTNQSLKRCQALRSSVLAAAFSGKLIPQNADDEPAEALLKRIAERTSCNGRKLRGTNKASVRQEKARV